MENKIETLFKYLNCFKINYNCTVILYNFTVSFIGKNSNRAKPQSHKIVFSYQDFWKKVLVLFIFPND